MARTYLNQFGTEYDIPPEILAAVANGKLKDTSWGNDVAPTFAVCDSVNPDDESVKVWVDHPVMESRETGAMRFTVAHYDEDGDWLNDALETDSLPELLAYLDDHFSIGPADCQPR